MAHERISGPGDAKLRGLLTAGDPHREVRDTWHAKETLRGIYDISCAEVGAATVEQLTEDSQDPGMPEEVNRLGRTLRRWRTRTSNWYHVQVTNGPTEAANNLMKRVKRVGFAFHEPRESPHQNTTVHWQTQLEPPGNTHSRVKPYMKPSQLL